MAVSASVANAYNPPQDDILDSDSIQIAALSDSSEGLNMYARSEPLYKTPEAQAFQEYGKFSTEGATGSVDISIPIHTISCRDLQVNQRAYLRISTPPGQKSLVVRLDQVKLYTHP